MRRRPAAERRSTSGAAGPSLAAPLIALCVLAPVRVAQDSGYETFAEVDPYTQGAPDRLRALGYESFGPFPWLKDDDTSDVREKIGGVPMLWVETAHFRIGSTLGTYELGDDRAERARVEHEIERLREKLGKLKAKKREVDPWLRLHLYAQRAEDLYEEFHADFGLTEASYADVGPYLGQPRKFVLLLCERMSEHNRHASLYLEQQHDFQCRFGWSANTMGVTASAEAFRGLAADGRPADALLHCSVASGLAQLFVDAYRANDYGAPEWLRRGYSHVVWRRIDPRLVVDAGHSEARSVGDDDHEWERRVRNLVSNDYTPATAEMLAWPRGAMEPRDHMVAWSKLSFLLTEAEGDRARFLTAVCVRRTEKAAPEAAAEAQALALSHSFGLEPAELDAEWARWVETTYPKR